jgi:hypothetical protein
MPYLRASEARLASLLERSRVQKSARQILSESARAFDSEDSYDVFLSHSYDDAEVILGVRTIMKSLGLKVYVDWIDDSALDRGKVTAKTAAVLRRRMQASSGFVYAHSPSAKDSVWMPWELGYFDSLRPAHVWILPLVETSDSEFRGQEYLGLYPALDRIEDLAGRLELGFTNVGPYNEFVPLAKAVAGGGIEFVAR